MEYKLGREKCKGHEEGLDWRFWWGLVGHEVLKLERQEAAFREWASRKQTYGWEHSSWWWQQGMPVAIRKWGGTGARSMVMSRWYTEGPVYRKGGLTDCLAVHTMYQALKGQISCLGVDHNLMGKWETWRIFDKENVISHYIYNTTIYSIMLLYMSARERQVLYDLTYM